MPTLLLRRLRGFLIWVGWFCVISGDFNGEPTKVPCPKKGISAGLWVDLQGAGQMLPVLSLVLPASAIGLARVALGGTLFWVVPWLPLGLRGVGLIAVVGFSRIFLSLPLFWLLGGR